MYLDKGTFKTNERWFSKHFFLILSLVKIYIYLFKSFIGNVYVEVRKNLGKVVKTRVFA
jgi:hypothetical protein